MDVEGLLKADMKKSLDEELSGVKRPIALLCTDDIPIRRKTDNYLIAHLEILHDLKSLIGKWFHTLYKSSA